MNGLRLTKFFVLGILLSSYGITFAEPSAASEAGAAGCAEGVVISSIEFKGLEHTKPRVVERELLNKVGEPFSAEKFEAEKLRLQDLDLFTEITVACTPAAPQPTNLEPRASSLIPGFASARLTAFRFLSSTRTDA